MENTLKNNTCKNDWITLLYTWNTINQLYFNKKKTDLESCKKTKKQNTQKTQAEGSKLIKIRGELYEIEYRKTIEKNKKNRKLKKKTGSRKDQKKKPKQQNTQRP